MGDKKAENRKLFVGGLSKSTDRASLQSYMSRFGEIDDCVVMIDRSSNQSRGFGFVTFKDFDDAQHCLKQDVHTIDNREVEVKRSIPRHQEDEPKPADPETAKVFLGGLSHDTTKDDIMAALAEYGIVSAQIMTAKDTEKPRGFAYAFFDSVQSAQKIVKIKWVKILDREAECKLAVSKDELQSHKRKNTGPPSAGFSQYQDRPPMDRYEYMMQNSFIPGGYGGRQPYGYSTSGYPSMGGYSPGAYGASGYGSAGGYDYRSAAYPQSAYDMYSTSRAYAGSPPASGMGGYGQSTSALGPSRGSYTERDRMASRNYTHPYSRR